MAAKKRTTLSLSQSTVRFLPGWTTQKDLAGNFTAAMAAMAASKKIFYNYLFQ
ncbi:hypothetical protein [Desulfocastanea catecholica]